MWKTEFTLTDIKTPHLIFDTLKIILSGYQAVGKAWRAERMS
jgi:hypothetical protein